ncbi:hypothetical protein [Eoetvoesiella caeni]
MTPPRIAYQNTRQYLQAMQDADQLDDLALAWELFLIFHQRTWNKCEAHYTGKRFWGPLLPKYSTRRKRDPILVYVHQARHVDEHGIQPIARVQHASTVVTNGTLTSGSRITGGGEYVIGPGSTATIKVMPATVLSNPVTNQGRTYDPPTLDGSTMPPVLRIAEEAIKFFGDLFAEIDTAGGD